MAESIIAPSTRKNVVAIGTSAGGIEAVRFIVSQLPADFAASIFLVIHTSAAGAGTLRGVLERSGRLPVEIVETSLRIEPGVIYLAGPDRHLLLEAGVARASTGPKENRFRPAIDPLFRSAAAAYGPRVIGVILTGFLDDGASGLRTVKELGGTAIVQDPADAMAASMPQSALTQVRADYCVPLSAIPSLLVQVTGETLPANGGYDVPKPIDIEIDIAGGTRALDAGVLDLGTPSNCACPDCHGVLLEIKEGDGVRFRCHTGHAYSAGSLLTALDEKIEEASWNTIRALDEKMVLAQQLAVHARDKGDLSDAARLLDEADEAERLANQVRQALVVELKHGRSV